MFDWLFGNLLVWMYGMPRFLYGVMLSYMLRISNVIVIVATRFMVDKCLP